MVEFSAKQFSDQAHECIPYVKLTVAGIKISSIRVWSPGDERPSICKSLNMIRSSIKILEPAELNLTLLTQKKFEVKSKYAFFSSVGDPGVLALLPCPSSLPAINDNTIS